jgi:hypothetical protein
MDLENELDRLYRVPAAAFVAERNQLVKTLRGGGLRDEAEQVARLPRPSPVAWLVNQLHFRSPGELAELLAAGRALRDAQEGLAASDEFAARKRAERDALEAAVTIALSIAEEDGTRPNAGLKRKVELTLSLLAASPEGTTPRPGRMSIELEPLGFDALALAADAPAKSAASPEEGAEARTERIETARTALDAAVKETRRLETEVERKKARYDRAASDAENAERLADAARRARDEARREAEAERARLDAASAELAELTRALAAMKSGA